MGGAVETGWGRYGEPRKARSRGVGLVGRAVETGWRRCSEPRKARRGVVSRGGVVCGWGCRDWVGEV